MSRQRFLWLLVAAVVVLTAALFWSAQRNASSTSEVGGALLPKLAQNANGITEISVRHDSTAPNVTLRNQGGTWTVEQRADYPADVSKVRKLVASLTDAKIIEQKTSDPSKFPVIGVEDPSGATAAGTEIGWAAPDGKHSVIIGKSAGEGNFARRGGENVSYTVEPSISVETEPKYWIEPQLVDIPTTSIQGIEVKPASGPGYSVHRAPAPAAAASSTGGSSPGGSASAAASKAGAASAAAASTGHARAAAAASGEFSLEGVPAGRKAAEPATLAPSPSVLSSLTADDVSPASNVDFTKPTVATVTLADGTVLTVTGTSSGDKHWIELKSSKDTALDAKLAGRAFEIPGYRYDSIFRPIDQLLVPKEPPPSAKGAKSPSAGPDSPVSSPIPASKKKPKDSPTQP
ncbi:MAG TPA: DUF4340 domain-containing protein [Steroidobacteraceae bacterium]|jgi:hypothetical protein|nr:DUF4340 domain-containing protein [Steroidobacteraceae bacterium]